jgi:hypothetical protein
VAGFYDAFQKMGWRYLIEFGIQLVAPFILLCGGQLIVLEER